MSGIDIDIYNLRGHYENGNVIISIHARERLRQRNIKLRDVRNCVMTGRIIEQYPNDYLYPSCLILGDTAEGKAVACGY